jgi:3-hydroxyisobutyrate dehydrogenase-like beta-hydroxyacid dehydrogenase
MADRPTIGFIGLGVMGEPMCRNIAARSGAEVIAFDVRKEPLARLAGDGVTACSGVAEIAGRAELIFLSLPGGPELEAVCFGGDGIAAHAKSGTTVVDFSTSPVALTRDVAARLGASGISFADTPVARTRQAAKDGTLSVMVGASPEVFQRIRPIIEYVAEEITHCGPVGSGQIVKLMNNMVLFQTVSALAEALTVARAAGLDGSVLFETLSKGSADSFALRNHGMRSLLPGDFPTEAFSVDYALKDLSYALSLAAETGIDTKGAKLAQTRLEAAHDAELGAAYFPALIETIG